MKVSMLESCDYYFEGDGFYAVFDSSNFRTNSRSSGKSKSRPREGRFTISSLAPTSFTRAQWRWNEFTPKSYPIKPDGAINSAFVPFSWRSGAMTTTGGSSARSIKVNTSSREINGRSAGKTKTPRVAYTWATTVARLSAVF